MALLWKKDEPIIRSVLETDVYKILMLYYIFEYYPYLKVKWAFKNRKVKIKLGSIIELNQLNEEFQAVEQLRFGDAEIAFFRTWGMFPEEFLRALRALRLKRPVVTIGDDGQLYIEAEGTWMETTLWEIYILAIIAELYGRGQAAAQGISEQALYDEGMRRLKEKVEFLQGNPQIKLALFGLRRRFSGLWEDTVTDVMLSETKNITGVSNVFLAHEFKVEPIGTNAHELPMAEYAVARHMGPNAVHNAPYEVLRKWQQLYGHKALIMLPDTFGSDVFLRDLPSEYARHWRGYRQDSGDPVEKGYQYIADYQRRGIDPRDKLILFTDGLDCGAMHTLHKTFHQLIQIGFGVGTNFTNDLGPISPLSIVMKLIEAAGNPTIKLSDNIAKAMGPETEIEIAKRIFGYTNGFTEATTY